MCENIPKGKQIFAPKNVLVETIPEAQDTSLEEAIEEANDDIFRGFENAIAIHNSAERPTFGQVYLDLAIALSRRSTCSRRHVGCAIVSRDFRRVLSVGYNGNAAGLKNECDNSEASGACGCLHAEENAVISCSEPTITPKIVYTTVYPCKMCAKRIIQLGGVERIYYMDEYRNEDAAEILDQAEILVSRITPYGGADV
jgi:dCMP deaminase